jgi:hypothetical protein
VRITGIYENRVVPLRNVFSFVLGGPSGVPVFTGTEYRLPEGSAWTFAGQNEEDFDRILSGSGILQMPGTTLPPGESSLLCVPFLGCGAPVVFRDVAAFLVRTEREVPFFLALEKSPEHFEFFLYTNPDFQKRVQAFCSCCTP